jgi:hypothetical protein
MLGTRLRSTVLVLTLLLFLTSADLGAASEPPLLDRDVVDVLHQEISGTEARRTIQELTLHHRMRGSRGFHAAAEAIRGRLEAYGLDGVEIVKLVADGERFYGTQRSRPAWDVEFAELWELRPESGDQVASKRVASYEMRPVTLAQDSAAGEVTADLVDVGAGTDPTDYEGKEVRGRVVLTSSQPGAVRELAVGTHGAAGIVSYAQNQRSAWWKEDETLVRWGHMGTFPAPQTFAFMVSLQQARGWREQLAAGERVRLRATVRAGQHPGFYEIPMATIPGSDPVLGEREIVFSCHLDHQLPGANDNASGCATILEVARALRTAIDEGRLPPPSRTIRFVWPAEIEGTIALLASRPELARRALAVVHMDMVGGDAERTKAVFHVTRSPASLPSFVNDVAAAFGGYVNEQSSRHAGGESVRHPFVDPEGGAEALGAEMAEFSMGSDHQVWTEGTYRVPAIYLNDWPDRYIHTHADSVENIDATKLARAAFIGAASAWYLARLEAGDVGPLLELLRGAALARTARALERQRAVDALELADDGSQLVFHWGFERAILGSVSTFVAVPEPLAGRHREFLDGLQRLATAAQPRVTPTRLANPESARVYVRGGEPRGPMNGFGYSYLDDRRKALELPRPELLDYRGLRGAGGEYAYEALNLVDGRRNVGAIADALAGIYGPVPWNLVAAYLETLQKIGILEVR